MSIKNMDLFHNDVDFIYVPGNSLISIDMQIYHSGRIVILTRLLF